MFFCILLFEGTFTSFFKGKKSKRSHKTEGSKQSRYFLLFLLNKIRLRIRIHTSDEWIGIRIEEAQKHVDPVDPDSDNNRGLTYESAVPGRGWGLPREE
jgi:hypothetical protein